ncbi:hypothetical protein [Marinactinospora rubrisoli]|uniref:TetR family transcriptional regulator n=1 Tax=Marinactinospora rubrisoli TaxID=2715399 RepID=A0ABW2KPU2_9ACTN
MPIEHPQLSVEQVMAALAALGAAPVADPDLRPTGPTQDDAPELLGALLAAVELEAAARLHFGAAQPAGLAALTRGWRQQLGGGRVTGEVLLHRLQRTAADWEDTTGGPDKPAIAQAATAALLAAQILLATANFAEQPETFARALDEAEGGIAAALTALYETRLLARGQE